ncbi:hypothetical protein CPBF1521_10790 [Xanthomonas arboricola pv. juglandis]|nr:hypothetical protein CPBF1521_10790 [Xanthomonas arboricola pv. juglandis]SYZ58875.1 hypothetical protein CPBF427_09740 [Xanthomonas arboricola pv. juglandis]
MAASMPPHGPAPGRGTTLPALLLLIGKQCFTQVLMPADSVAYVICKPSICCHVARNGRSEERAAHLALRISFRNRQQLVVLARVPAWDLERHGCRARAYMDVLAACPTPVRVQAPAANRGIRTKPADLVCEAVLCRYACASACSKPTYSYRTRRCRPQDWWRGAASSVGRCTGARSKSTPLQESWDTKTKTASRSHCRPSGLHRPANERCYATAAVLPATTPRSR